MTFDPTKPVQTRCGYPAKIIYTERGGVYPIVVLVTYPSEDCPDVKTYTRDGEVDLRRPCAMDLVNIPEKHVRWLNIYKNKEGKFYSGPMGTEPGSDEHAIARRRIEFEEGQFDE